MRTRLAAAVCGLVAAWLPAAAVPALASVAVAPPVCTIVGTPGADVLEGTPGNDVICGRGGDDRLVGRGGEDQLRGGRGDDELSGGGGDDLARGEQGKDVIKGGGGDDRLRGGKGNDQLDGRDARAFTDIVRCGPGTADRAFADMGDDVVSGCEVVNQNDPPTDIRLEPAAVAENSPVGTLVGTLEAKDPDPGEKHSFSLVPGAGAGDNGSFTITGTRLLTASALDFEVDASLSVRVRARDLEGATYAKNLTVAVTDVAENVAPVPVDDNRATPEDTDLVLPVSGAGSPTANDTDANGDPLTVAAVSGAVGGTATIAAGTIRFTPTANLCGVAAGRFDYTVSDGRGGTAVGRFTVDITCVADDPTAADDAVTRAEDSAAAAIAVLANDHDADGDPLVIDSVTQPAGGTVTITGGGSGLTYEPDPDFCSATPDTFDYTLTPGGATATVSVTVTCADDEPTAVDDTATVAEDSGTTEIDVVGNDTDVDAGPMSVASVTQPANGTVAITGGGAGLTYEPDPDFCSATPDGFDYALAPGGSTATVSVTVTCLDDPPVAVDDTARVVRDSGATAITVLANDTDVDGGPKSVASVTQPLHGTVAITGGGTGVTYQPSAGFCSTTPDTFTYTLNGGGSATVWVTVECFDPGISTDLSATPTAPAIGQPFRYDATVDNSGNVPLDSTTMIFTAPVQLAIASVTTGTFTGFSEFAAGVGVTVSYEKNTAPGVFTLWGSSPNTTTNTTMTSPPPGLGAGEYVVRVRWQYGQAAPGATDASPPRVNGQITNPDRLGNPVTTATSIQASVQVSGVFTAGATNVNASVNLTFTPSAPAVRSPGRSLSRVSGGRDRLPDRRPPRRREDHPREGTGAQRAGAAAHAGRVADRALRRPEPTRQA